MSLFPNDQSDPLNGYHSTEQLNPLTPKFNSEPNEIEDHQVTRYDPETIKLMQKSFIFLIVTGVVIGIILAVGLIYVLDRFDINGKPPQIEQIQ